MIKLAAAFN